jgi:hypothetical protein
MSWYKFLSRLLRQSEPTPPEQLRPALGDVVEIIATDWGIFAEQLSANYPFEIVRGWIYGQVIRMTEDGITVAPQVFEAGEVRYALAVPWVTISQITILQHKEAGNA